MVLAMSTSHKPQSFGKREDWPVVHFLDRLLIDVGEVQLRPIPIDRILNANVVRLRNVGS